MGQETEENKFSGDVQNEAKPLGKRRPKTRVVQGKREKLITECRAAGEREGNATLGVFNSNDVGI